MENVYEKLQSCYQAVRAKTDFVPRVGLILGSGLGDFASQVKVVQTIPYHEIPGFPISTVSGHAGQYVLGYVGETPVIIMQGRVHYYEGYDMQDIVLPTRLMGLLGAKTLFLTNAAGGANRTFKPGTLMMITDHVSTFVPSPLRGANVEQLGVRFPDMSRVYDAQLCQLLRDTAQKTGIELREGVYLQAPGPQFETPAEIRAFQTLGADAVGMSTACEAIAARHMGLKVCAVSCITNMAAGISGQPLSHEEVKETADRVSAEFAKLVWTAIAAME